MKENQRLFEMYRTPSVTWVVVKTRMVKKDWICILDEETTYKNLMGKPLGKLPPGRFEDNIILFIIIILSGVVRLSLLVLQPLLAYYYTSPR
jgi:hypothetical protein